MALAEIGESLLVPFDLVVEIDGFENEVPTGGKEGLVINRLEAGIDVSTGEQIYNYFLEFDQQFELVNVSGTVIQTVNSFWFSEDSLDGQEAQFEKLPLTTGEINTRLSNNRKTISNSQKSVQSILKSVPQGDLFRRPISSLNSIITQSKGIADSIKFNPNNAQSINNIMTDVEGSSLLAEDAATFSRYAEIFKTQQETVAGKSQELVKEEQQSFTNSNKAENSESTSVNTFIEKLPNLKGAEALILTAEDFSPLDWDTLESPVPKTAQVLPEELSPTQEAAQLFPLLDPSAVVKSGIL